MCTAPRYTDQCSSFLGLLFMDGQPPFFERYIVNSASVRFREWDFFPDPNIRREELKAFELSELRKQEFDINNKILLDPDQRGPVSRDRPSPQ